MGQITQTQKIGHSLVDRTLGKTTVSTINAVSGHSAIDVDIAGGHQLRMIGGYHPEALAQLIRDLFT